MNKKTKIICTMGPNTDDRNTLYDLAVNGMNIARLNFSHGDHDEQLHRINLIKSIREELNIPIAMLLDTKGPEIRTGVITDDKKITLVQGNELILTTVVTEGTDKKIYVSYSGLPKDVKENDKILIDDGLIELKVKSTTDIEVICEIINGGELGSKKGINVPGVNINLPSITNKDRDDIIFGINHGVDFVAASFVRNVEAIKEIRAILNECNSDIAIIAKIENQEGFNNLDEILKEADGIMVARGDLGVEVPTQEVPFIQKEIIKKCNDAYKPVITATQMLDSMMRNPRPTRAEVTDIANAIYDGTDAIMLSGETAIGKYPIEALKMMVDIAIETESHLDYTSIFQEKDVHKTRGVSSAICYASVATAMNLNAKLILASTITGDTTRIVSKFRPEAQVIGLTPLDRTLRKMQIYWGVKPLKIEEVNSTDNLMEQAIATVKEEGLVSSGDLVILTAGLPSARSGVTNMIKAVSVE